MNLLGIHSTSDLIATRFGPDAEEIFNTSISSEIQKEERNIYRINKNISKILKQKV